MIVVKRCREGNNNTSELSSLLYMLHLVSRLPRCCNLQVKKLLNESIHSDQDLSLLAVKKEDIFFQFISEAKISDDLAQINLGKP